MQVFNIYPSIANARCCFLTDYSILFWLFSILILACIIFVISSIINVILAVNQKDFNPVLQVTDKNAEKDGP